MSKSLGTNLIFNILRNISNIIFPIITAPYVARVLGPECLGLANFATAYAGYFILVAALGIPNYGIREVAKSRGNVKALSNIFSQLFSINVITTCAVSLVYLLTLVCVDKLRSEYLIFIISGVALFTNPFSIDWLFSGLEEFRYITLRTVIVRTLSIILLFLCVQSERDVVLYVLLNVFAGTFNQILNLIIARKNNIKIRFTLIGVKTHIKPLLLLFSSSIAVSLYTTINTLMLGFLTTYDQVSFYHQANTLSRTLLAVVTSMSEVMVPRLSYLNRLNDWMNINVLVEKSVSIVSFLAWPIAIGVIIISPIFIPLFLGDNFNGTILPLQIMALITVIIGYNNITTVQILLGLGFDNKLLYCVTVGACVTLLLNLFLIPLYGAVGAAISSVVGELSILVVGMYFVVKSTMIRYTDYFEFFKSIISSLIFIPLFILLRRFFDGWAFIFIYISVCVIAYYITQMLLKSKSAKILNKYIYSKIK